MTKEKDAKYILREEIASRTLFPCVFYFVFGVVMFFYHFGCERFSLQIKILSIFIIITSLLRFVSSLKVQKKDVFNNHRWRWMLIFIWLNSFFCGLLFSLASIELQMQGPHFIFVIIMIAGLVSASVLSLSGDPFLYIPHQSLLLLPQSFIGTYFFYKTGDPVFIGIGLICIIYFLYELYQFGVFTKQLYQRIYAQIELKNANMELQNSQDKLIDKTFQLISASKLAALGEMSRGVAHEINNPLTIIALSLEKLKKHFINSDQMPALELINKSDVATNRISNIITALKYFSEGPKSDKMESTPLLSIIDRVLSLCKEVLVVHKVSLNIMPPPDVKIICHPNEIIQVILTLIKNAEDALSLVDILSERWIHVDFFQGPEKITISISNGGPKIADSIKEQLFLPFFSTKELGHHAGLGLSAAKGILKGHGGDLYYDDTQPRTTFKAVIQINRIH